MIALMLPILVSAPVRLSQELSMLGNLDRLRREIAGDISFIAGRDGPVACESLALCYWAGKDFELDFFITGQKLDTGSIDEKAFVQALREHRFAAVQVCGRGGIPFSQRLPDRIDRVIATSYRVGRFSPHIGFILVPGAPEIDAQTERREVQQGLPAGTLAGRVEPRARYRPHLAAARRLPTSRQASRRSSTQQGGP